MIYRHTAMTLVRPRQECVSACVFILIAGAVRTPTDGASIGLHRPLLVSWRNMDYAEARAKYDGLMRYLREYFLDLGVSPEAYDIMMRTSSYDMHYFTWWEMDALGLRGEGPAWRARFVERQAAAAEQEAHRGWAPGAAPALPKIDESWREVVFMPGDLYGKDYYAGVDIQRQPLALEPMDLDAQRLHWEPPDVVGFAVKLAHAVWDILKPVWWLLAILLFEILRADPNNWPDHPFRSRRDQWRLAPFRPHPASVQLQLRYLTELDRARRDTAILDRQRRVDRGFPVGAGTGGDAQRQFGDAGCAELHPSGRGQ